VDRPALVRHLVEAGRLADAPDLSGVLADEWIEGGELAALREVALVRLFERSQGGGGAARRVPVWPAPAVVGVLPAVGGGGPGRVRRSVGTLLQPDAWNHRSAGPGSKGERRYAWAWLATTSPRHHLLIRRSLSDPTELAYFYTWVRESRPVTLPTLVRVAGMR
jgi:hypothetical protein